ncbi:MAG: Coenzyme F420 hydrogenase/dehydrogenase, beta subunit C-terminal domain [Candidatus Thorarchaeota archaeon]|jgi:coenzyme F420 hydrogenase subunit beta
MTRDHNSAVEKSQAWLKENVKRYAFKKLEREIIKTGACVECGSCVEGCPVEVLTGEYVESKYTPTLTGKCTACGICYAMCPRTSYVKDENVGEYLSTWKVRSLGDHPRQDGGGVTAILLESGGTIYTHAPIIQEMLRGFKEGLSALAVVGTACNIEAITKMQNHPAGLFNVDKKASVFKISLFCMESFDYEKLKGFLKNEGVKIDKVDRFAISKGQFMVTVGDEEKSWPVADLNAIAATSCSYCLDLTGMHSDISCGNIGSDEGWTTVIVRTKQGEKVFKEVIKAGLIEAEKIEDKAFTAVVNTARSKRNKLYKLEPHH